MSVRDMPSVHQRGLDSPCVWWYLQKDIIKRVILFFEKNTPPCPLCVNNMAGISLELSNSNYFCAWLLVWGPNNRTVQSIFLFQLLLLLGWNQSPFFFWVTHRPLCWCICSYACSQDGLSFPMWSSFLQRSAEPPKVWTKTETDRHTHTHKHTFACISLQKVSSSVALHRGCLFSWLDVLGWIPSWVFRSFFFHLCHLSFLLSGVFTSRDDSLIEYAINWNTFLWECLGDYWQSSVNLQSCLCLILIQSHLTHE